MTLEHSDSQPAHERSMDQQPVVYERLGIDYPLGEDSLHVQCGKVKVIENLDQCPALRSLALISNRVEKIENLEAVPDLRTLELYQNFIHRIENLECLDKLETLDLSFNQIRQIANLERNTELRQLYLTANKLEKIRGLDSLTKLELLELGSNRIRMIENLGHLTELRELWLGKNKLTSMVIPYLPKLRTISLQSNRIERWDPSLVQNTTIRELFLSHNCLPAPPPKMLEPLAESLVTLDLAGNTISTIEPLTVCKNLEELWLNDNKIEKKGEIQNLAAFKSLKTIYLERNPVQDALGPAYRTLIVETVPWIKQIDALLLSDIQD